MMGNAAIQAAERAREILAAAVSVRLQVPADRLVFADRRVFDTENPDRAVTFQEAVCLAEARVGTIGTTGSYTPPKSAAHFKGGGVGPSPTYSYTAAVVEWMSIRQPDGSRCRACGLRTTSAARSTRRWCAGRSKAASAAGEDPPRAASEGSRQAGAIGARDVSRHRLARTLTRGPAVGRRRRPCVK